MPTATKPRRRRTNPHDAKIARLERQLWDALKASRLLDRILVLLQREEEAWEFLRDRLQRWPAFSDAEYCISSTERWLLEDEEDDDEK